MRETKRACPSCLTADKPARRGSALLLTTILLFVVLSMVVSLTYITVMEQKMSGKTKSSVGSFFNADSGVEWALNRIANIDDGSLITTAFGDTDIADGVECPTGFNCTLYFLDENGKVITNNATSEVSDIKAVRSVGTNETGDVTQRAIEAAVGAGGGGIYTRWGFDECGTDTEIYDGEAVFGFNGNVSAGPVCLDELLSSRSGYISENQMYIQSFTGKLPVGTSLKCAVCERN